MALTIDQAPHEMAVVGQKLIFVLSSTQVSEDQFRYVCYVTIGGDTIGPINIVPNPANKGIIDIAEIVKPYLTLRIAPYSAGETSIQLLGQAQTYSYKNEDPTTDTTCRITAVNFYEGWVVAGVFTEDPDSDGPVLSTHYFMTGTKQIFDGYRKAVEAATWFTDKPTQINYNQYPGLVPFIDLGTYPTPIIFPVYESECGIISFCSDDGTATTGGIATYKIFLLIVDSAGASHTSSVTVTGDAGQITHVGCFPGNFLSNTSGLDNPLDYPGFRYYMMWIANGVTPGDAQLSQTLVFVPAEDYDQDCYRNNLVTVSWQNSDGTYDTWAFPKVNQLSFQYDRKRFKKVVGTYEASTFDFETYDRGLTEIEIQSPQFIEVNSDWLSEIDYKFLQKMIRSKIVYIISSGTDYDFGGNFVPCVIDSSDYLQRRERNHKMYNITLKIRIANDQWT